MFTTPVERISKVQVTELANDKAKMDAMVEDVSTFLAYVLCIRDDMTPRKPLVQLCHEELRYLPTREKMEEMRAIDAAYKFAASAHWLATHVSNAAKHAYGHNIDVSIFAARDIYYLTDEVVSTGANKTRVHVGGLYMKLAREVDGLAMRWLEELDRALCNAADMERGEAATLEMHPVRAKLAAAIARRAAFEDLELDEDGLSARALDGLIADEVRRNSHSAQEEVQADLRALETMLCLARSPRGSEARAAVAEEWSLRGLCRLVASPPLELARQPLFVDAALQQLGRALVPGMDAEVRVELVSFWADNHGKAAISAAVAACTELMQWSPSSKTMFVSSLVREGTGKKHSSIPLPRMRFLHTSRRSIVRRAACRRHGLDERGVRVARLVQAVWELIAQGVFVPGVVAAEPAAEVALVDIITSRFACATLERERRTSSHGVRLGRLLGILHDSEGSRARRVQRACCALSRFSCDELEVAFSTNGHILPVVCGALSARTRAKMTCAVDPEYHSFAADALALVLPLVEKRRQAIGTRSSESTHPLVDLLMTSEKAEAWDPLHGSLRLDIADLSAAHAQLRVALDALHDAGVLVRRTGGASKKKKTWYEFHSMTLCKLLASRV